MSHTSHLRSACMLSMLTILRAIWCINTLLNEKSIRAKAKQTDPVLNLTIKVLFGASISTKNPCSRTQSLYKGRGQLTPLRRSGEAVYVNTGRQCAGEPCWIPAVYVEILWGWVWICESCLRTEAVGRGVSSSADLWICAVTHTGGEHTANQAPQGTPNLIYPDAVLQTTGFRGTAIKSPATLEKHGGRAAGQACTAAHRWSAAPAREGEASWRSPQLQPCTGLKLSKLSKRFGLLSLTVWSCFTRFYIPLSLGQAAAHLHPGVAFPEHSSDSVPVHLRTAEERHRPSHASPRCPRRHPPHSTQRGQGGRGEGARLSPPPALGTALLLSAGTGMELAGAYKKPPWCEAAVPPELPRGAKGQRGAMINPNYYPWGYDDDNGERARGQAACRAGTDSCPHWLPLALSVSVENVLSWRGQWVYPIMFLGTAGLWSKSTSGFLLMCCLAPSKEKVQFAMQAWLRWITCSHSPATEI